MAWELPKVYPVRDMRFLAREEVRASRWTWRTLFDKSMTVEDKLAAFRKAHAECQRKSAEDGVKFAWEGRVVSLAVGFEESGWSTAGKKGGHWGIRCNGCGESQGFEETGE